MSIPDERTTDVPQVFSDAKQALDLAYSAGALESKAQGYAQADSLKYAASPASQDSNWKNTSAEPEKHWN